MSSTGGSESPLSHQYCTTVMPIHNKSLPEHEFHLQKCFEESLCNQNRLQKLNK